MRIAVVGTGISGMAAAYLLQRAHDVTVFEQSDDIGGHTNTVDVNESDRTLAIDTGFIVHNKANYPNLVRLFQELGVATQDSDMSFSVRCERCDLEFSAQSLGTLFAQRRNILRPSFYGLIADARRFLGEARAAIDDPTVADWSLSEFLAARRYGQSFIRHLIVPLAASIWSTSPAESGEMPATFCFRFFHNHGMLNRADPTVWRTVVGGSRQYVRTITAGYRDRLNLNCGIAEILREPQRVRLTDVHGRTHEFDGVVVAAHADQALRMLQDPTDDERACLSAFRYSRNRVVLHTDPSVLPRRPILHASWNYSIANCRSPERHCSLTYYMNRLQRLSSDRRYCVTVNPQRPIDGSAIERRIEYDHPLYTRSSVQAQRRLPALNGVRRTWYCGAYFGYGFHEDGLVSAITVAEQLGVRWRAE